MMKPKLQGALRSKTLWFAVALAALSALSTQLDQLGDVLKDHAGPVGVAVSILIAVLRVLTTAPLEDLAPPPREPPHDDGTASDDNA